MLGASSSCFSPEATPVTSTGSHRAPEKAGNAHGYLVRNQCVCHRVLCHLSVGTHISEQGVAPGHHGTPRIYLLGLSEPPRAVRLHAAQNASAFAVSEFEVLCVGVRISEIVLASLPSKQTKPGSRPRQQSWASPGPARTLY